MFQDMAGENNGKGFISKEEVFDKAHLTVIIKLPGNFNGCFIEINSHNIINVSFKQGKGGSVGTAEFQDIGGAGDEGLDVFQKGGIAFLVFDEIMIQCALALLHQSVLVNALGVIEIQGKKMLLFRWGKRHGKSQ